MRLGINIPREIYDQIKESRPEVNLSQVCREALEQRISLGERAIARVAEDGMEGEVTRLAQSVRNLLMEPDWAGYAREDARDWLRVVSKEEWEQFIDLWYDLEEFGMSPLIKTTNLLFERIREYEDWFMAQDRVGNYGAAWSKAVGDYERAWVDYVSKVRLKVDPLYRYQYGEVAP